MLDSWLSACLDTEFGHKQLMVHPEVVSSEDGGCDEDISAVSLSDRIVQGVLLFGSRMPLGGLLSGRELEDGISYKMLVFSKNAKKVKPIVIAVPIALFPITGLHVAVLLPTQASKSPRMISLSLDVMEEIRSFHGKTKKKIQPLKPS